MISCPRSLPARVVSQLRPVARAQGVSKKPFGAPSAQRSLQGTWLITLPKTTVERVLDDDRFMGWPLRSGIGNSFGKNWPHESCVIHFPNIAQHIGDVSAIGNPEPQVSSIFVGEDFDCADWLR